MTRQEMVREYLRVLDLQDREPDYVLLGELIRRHVATFAFSSVGPRLGDDLPLDFASLFDRIVARRRGGYCFEQNGLFFEVLVELGYAPTLGLARVIHGQDTHPGLTHRISLVEHAGTTYVVDVGFGHEGPRLPVPMTGDATIDGDRTYRVAECRPGEHHLQIVQDGEYFSLYRFELVRYGQADCEVGHFYSHRHPAAVFVNHLVVSLILADEVRLLRDRQYQVIAPDGTRTSRIADSEQLADVLLGQMGLQVSEAEIRKLYADLLRDEQSPANTREPGDA